MKEGEVIELMEVSVEERNRIKMLKRFNQREREIRKMERDERRRERKRKRERERESVPFSSLLFPTFLPSRPDKHSHAAGRDKGRFRCFGE